MGTIFTRYYNAAIFTSLAAQYGIHFMRMPDELRDVNFGCSAVVLGYYQLRVRVKIERADRCHPRMVASNHTVCLDGAT